MTAAAEPMRDSTSGLSNDESVSQRNASDTESLMTYDISDVDEWDDNAMSLEVHRKITKRVVNIAKDHVLTMYFIQAGRMRHQNQRSRGL